MDNLIGKYTWFKTGGPAKALLKFKSIEELQAFLQENKEKYLVLGAGSNLIVNDLGFDGYIIRTQHFLRKITLMDNNIIEVEAGVSDLNLAQFAANNNIQGFEFLCTIPGTVGGAIRMNAGCLGKEVKHILLEVTCLNERGQIVTLTNEACNFKYRCSSINEKWIIIKGRFQGQLGVKSDILHTMNTMFHQKDVTQPIGIPSVGSVFKNPPGTFAWKVIDKAQFRGYRHKSVMVSFKHTNFIIHNDRYEGQVKSEDFVELTEIIKEKVRREQNIPLELEVKVVAF